MVAKIEAALGSLKGARIGVLGLAFKANTDDMREAPALTIIPQLVAGGARIRAYDPAAAEQARVSLPALEVAESVEAALADADAALVLTEWSSFRDLDWQQLARTMRRPLVIDLRNIYDPREMARQGMEYVALGRYESVPPIRAAAE
jgi:UDPglucose 6-dehydrogenase